VKNLDRSVWEFLHDDQFIKWVYSPDEESIAYWKRWMQDHPEKVPHLMQAREIIEDLADAAKPGQVQQMADIIWAGIQDDLTMPHAVSEVAPVRPESGGMVLPMAAGSRSFRKRMYWVAASLLVLALAGGMRYYFSPSHSSPGAPFMTGSVATLLEKENMQRTNQAAQAQQVWLVDGSRVTLQPGARIRHATFLQKDKREVYLEGNAFFEVAPDAARPFHVYTKDLIVNVLGTSFNVTTNENNGDITVLVHSGKVSVSKKTNPSRQQLILETNQQVLYKEQTHDLVQIPVNEINLRQQDIRQPATSSFSFDQAPVVEIFQTLEKAYGIPLFYDKKTFSACQVTTSLTNETFEEKLRIICEAIGATYKISENGVYIDGRPCKE
jgi:hypothetical protein